MTLSERVKSLEEANRIHGDNMWKATQRITALENKKDNPAQPAPLSFKIGIEDIINLVKSIVESRLVQEQSLRFQAEELRLQTEELKAKIAAKEETIPGYDSHGAKVEWVIRYNVDGSREYVKKT